MSTKKKIVITAAVTAVVCSMATLMISAVLPFLLSVDDNDNFRNKLDMIEYLLENKYLYDYDKSDLRESALSAYVEALDEPYTEYYSPKSFSDYQESLQDGYTGIGIIVAANDKDQIEVVAPFEGSPAYEAGIVPGDILKAVEGVDYTGQTLNEAVSVIRGGKEGTTVNITILRDTGEEKDITVERRDIANESVTGEMLDDTMGYIRISAFRTSSKAGGDSTSGEFRRELDTLTEQGMKSLIIDLRDNPGGVLDEVCDVADSLMPEGVILYQEDKNGERQYFNSDQQFLDIPLAVLINGNSASASEVLTGALKDTGRAVIVGEKSYGKGIVQDVYNLPDGSGISLTTAKYYTPNGICIHEIGIEPDTEIPMPDEYKDMYASMVDREKDTQLQKAIEILKEK